MPNSTLINTLDFGLWLKQVRHEKGLTRQQVADNAGGSISQQYVHAIETGKSKNIGSEKIQALAQGLEIPVQVLQEALFHQRYLSLALLNQEPNEKNLRLEKPENKDIPYVHVQPNLLALRVPNNELAPQIEHSDIALLLPYSRLSKPLEDGALFALQSGKDDVLFRYLLSSPEHTGDYYLLLPGQATENAPRLSETEYRIYGQVFELRKSKSLSWKNN